MRIKYFQNIAAAMLLSVAACGAPESAADLPELPTGLWQVSITLPGGDIETAIEINRDDGRLQATLMNGQEQVAIGEVNFSTGALTLRFPALGNEIRAELVDGELVGELTLVKRYGATQVMPFSARLGSGRENAGVEAASHDISGRWAVEFRKQDGSVSPSIGEFVQSGSQLFGTFLNPNGDHRYLAGHVRGNAFTLSTFNGAHAYLFSGEINEEGEIQAADFWSGTSEHQTWTAVRNENAELPDAYARTFLKPGYDSFEFEFPDSSGTPVSLADDRFEGKVVLVTLAGTWCPNCHDEARFLAPLYKEYRDRGLEIIALMYEHFEDHETAAERVRHFRDKFDIQYQTLIAGISEKTEAAKTLPALNAVLAFPTTIFIDRRGTVRKIHTGFSGPGTGEHYELLKEEFTTFITTLIEEPADQIGDNQGDN